MGATQVSTREIGSVQRNDLDTTTAGQAVVAKIIQGTNVTLSSTGTDAGTGDVTVNVVVTGKIAVTTQNTSASLNPTLEVLYLSAPASNITLTLTTSAVGNTGLKVIFKKTDSSAFTVTIDAAGTETIDGGLTATLQRQYESITIVSDGTNWQII